MRAVPRFCELYPGICLTTEEKARKNLSQDSRRVPVGTMKTAITAVTPCRHGVIAPHILNLKADGVAISASFWVFTHRLMVSPYQRFGTTYKSHSQG